MNMNSENAYELFREGKKHARENDHLKAIMLFEKAIVIEPEKGSIREAIATSYFNCGLYPAAKSNFQKAVSIDAANDFAHYGLGLCLVKEGKIKTAMGHFKIAAAMKPLNETYRNAVKRYNRIFEILHKKLPLQEEGQ